MNLAHRVGVDVIRLAVRREVLSRIVDAPPSSAPSERTKLGVLAAAYSGNVELRRTSPSCTPAAADGAGGAIDEDAPPLPQAAAPLRHHKALRDAVSAQTHHHILESQCRPVWALSGRSLRMHMNSACAPDRKATVAVDRVADDELRDGCPDPTRPHLRTHCRGCVAWGGAEAQLIERLRSITAPQGRSGGSLHVSHRGHG